MSTPLHVRIEGSTICFVDQQAQPGAFSSALTRYLRSERRTGRTLKFEQQAAQLAAQSFDNDTALAEFVKTVCVWGGYAGIGGRVCKHNQPDESKARFVAAKAAIEQEQLDLQTAIREVRALNGLGLSFASKHLRMLWPRHCPVLDSVLHEKLGYPMNSTGYCQLAEDCRGVAALLEREGVANPARDNQPEWYVADVEAAIFELVRA